MKKLISVVTPCFNEEDNVLELHRQIAAVFAESPEYDYEHIYIDNRSQDRTPLLLRELAKRDPRVKVIFNARNFGHIRSPFHGMLQARGDAVILMVSDLQDPPPLIHDFLDHWEAGYKVAMGIKQKTYESWPLSKMRQFYYRLLQRLSQVEVIRDCTGFGLFDRQVIEAMRSFNDPHPYLRGLVSEIGFEVAKIPYVQPLRKRGLTKNNFYTLYDMAMLGFTSSSKIPLRIAVLAGFVMSFIGVVVALGYLIAKLIFWNQFTAGTTPILLGVFMFSSVQLFFIGLLGEYIMAVHTQVVNRPLVVEKERLNFHIPVSQVADQEKITAFNENPGSKTAPPSGSFSKDH